MNFLWGVATSGHQIDGDNRDCDWWAWEQAGNIESGEVSGKATDHWNRWDQDLQNAASLGLNAYRFSVEWSRIEPQEGQWNQQALDWYIALIEKCEKLGLLPMVTLHHFTLPRWLSDKGGLTHPHFPDRFGGFVRKVAHAFGSRVPLWCTVNEPMLLAIGAYLGGVMPPAESDPRALAAAHRGLLKAHVLAYDTLHKHAARREGPWKDRPLEVGFAHNMVDFHALRAWHPAELWMVRIFRRYYNRAWLDAVTGRRQHFGIRGLLPTPRQVWQARGRRTVDFIGVNYYMKAYPCWGPQKKEGAQFLQFRNLPVGIRFQREGDNVSDLGWPIHPEGLGRMLRFASKYKLPIYVTENGIADAQDALRARFVQDHVQQVANAREHGADVRGYFHWSLLDNFEWVKGFGPRFGLWEVDYQTFERKARPSAQIYAQLVQQGLPGMRANLSP